MHLDYSKLTGKIVEKFGNRKNFAQAMELSERSLSLKLNGKISWKQTEIVNACDLLDITHNEIAMYFFTLKVQKNQT